MASPNENLQEAAPGTDSASPSLPANAISGNTGSLATNIQPPPHQLQTDDNVKSKKRRVVPETVGLARSRALRITGNYYPPWEKNNIAGEYDSLP